MPQDMVDDAGNRGRYPIFIIGGIERGIRGARGKTRRKYNSYLRSSACSAFPMMKSAGGGEDLRIGIIVIVKSRGRAARLDAVTGTKCKGQMNRSSFRIDVEHHAVGKNIESGYVCCLIQFLTIHVGARRQSYFSQHHATPAIAALSISPARPHPLNGVLPCIGQSLALKDGIGLIYCQFPKQRRN
jgi:hypothetical protein